FSPKPEPELYQDRTVFPPPATIIAASGEMETAVTLSPSGWSHSRIPWRVKSRTVWPWDVTMYLPSWLRSSVVPDQPDHNFVPSGESAISWSPPATMVDPSCDRATVDKSTPDGAGTVQRGLTDCTAGMMMQNRTSIPQNPAGGQVCIPIYEPNDQDRLRTIVW